MPFATYTVGASPYDVITCVTADGHGLPQPQTNIFVVDITVLKGPLPPGIYVVTTTNANNFTIATDGDLGWAGRIEWRVVPSSAQAIDWNLDVVSLATPIIDPVYSVTELQWDLTDAGGTIGTIETRDNAARFYWDLTDAGGTIGDLNAVTDYLTLAWELTAATGSIGLGKEALESQLRWSIFAEVPAPGQYFVTLSAQEPADGEEDVIPLAPLPTTILYDWVIRPRKSVEYTTVKDILEDAAIMLGFLSAADATPDIQERLVSALNTAVTEIYSRSSALNYFNEATLPLEIPSNTNVVALPPEILALTGYASLMDGAGAIQRNLSMLTHRTDFDRFAAVFADPSDSDIQALYCERSRDMSTLQAVTHQLFVTPTPETDSLLRVQVLYDAPRYVWADYFRETIVRLPHNYVTALLYPLVRKDTSSHPFFIAADRLPAIEEQYQAARQLLGLVDLAAASAAPRNIAATKANA